MYISTESLPHLLYVLHGQLPPLLLHTAQQPSSPLLCTVQVAQLLPPPLVQLGHPAPSFHYTTSAPEMGAGGVVIWG